MKEGVSVILCCYNSASRLPETLKYLALQKTREIIWEIIVVDNASTDSTRRAALDNWKRTDVPLIIVDEPKPGLSFARATGVNTSSFKTLIFCDDDNWLEENYIYEACAILQAHPDAGAVGGTGTAVANVALPPWFEKYKGCFACYPQAKQEGELNGVSSFLYGAGMVLRRDALKKIESRGFRPILPDRIGDKLTSGGDVELSYALRLAGYKLWFSEKLLFQHFLPSTRLTDDYLFRLMSVMSYCSGELIVYGYALNEKRVTTLTWFKDSVYQLFFFGRGIFKYLRSPSSLSAKLDFAFAYNRMKSVLHQFGMYGERYGRIIKLKHD